MTMGRSDILSLARVTAGDKYAPVCIHMQKWSSAIRLCRAEEGSGRQYSKQKGAV